MLRTTCSAILAVLDCAVSWRLAFAGESWKPYDVWHLSDQLSNNSFYVIETNYDRRTAPPDFDDRRYPAENCLDQVRVSRARPGHELACDFCCLFFVSARGQRDHTPGSLESHVKQSDSERADNVQHAYGAENRSLRSVQAELRSRTAVRTFLNEPCHL